MSAFLTIKARATDASHLELLHPLEQMPAGEFEILILDESISSSSPAARAAAFRAWVRRPRKPVGLADAGRDVIYAD